MICSSINILTIFIKIKKNLLFIYFFVFFFVLESFVLDKEKIKLVNYIKKRYILPMPVI